MQELKGIIHVSNISSVPRLSTPPPPLTARPLNELKKVNTCMFILYLYTYSYDLGKTSSSLNESTAPWLHSTGIT